MDSAPRQRPVTLLFFRSQRTSALHDLRRTLVALGTGLRNVLLSKGLAAGVGLYLMRYDSVVKLYKQALLLGTGAVALWLDLEDEPSPRGITIGVSRIVLLGVCYLLIKRAPLGLGPLLCGFATQIVPRVMFIVFKTVYIVARAVLRLLKRDRPTLPDCGTMKDTLESETCCICMDSSEVCDYVTPCSHAFHSMCLRKWASTSPRCPLCNRQISYQPSATQRLRNWFVLNYEEWSQFHRLCSNW